MYGFVCGKTISFLFSWFLKYTVNVASIEKKKNDGLIYGSEISRGDQNYYIW